jgi:hypothetical protein
VNKRKWRLTAILGLSLALFPGSALAAVSVNPVASTVHPGSQLTLDGASDLSEVIVKIYRPDHSLLYFNVVNVVDGHYSDTITLGSNETMGTYEVQVGQGDQISKQSITVTVDGTGGGGGGGSAPGVDAPVVSTDGSLTLLAGKTGQVSLGDEVTVSIPSGASPQELKVTIQKLSNTSSLLSEGDLLASPIFEILKNFTANFSQPVTLTFAFDKASVKDGQTPSVFYYDETKKAWVQVGGEVSGNHITVDVNHFTKYAVFVVDKNAAENPPVAFSDIAGHWAETNIKQAVGAGIVSGYKDGTFKPNRNVTRAEFALMLVHALKPQGQGGAQTFTDSANIGAWAQTAVAQAVQAGWLKGNSDGSFRPNAEITRAEMAVILANASNPSKAASQANASSSFADDKDIPTWAKGSVNYVMQAGLVQGKGGNYYAPQDSATRAEAVTVLLKLAASAGN